MIYKLETLESLIDFNQKFAVAYFKRFGVLQPMIVGYSSDNTKRFVILGVFKNDIEKDTWLRTASLVFLVNDVDKYVVMYEGWYVQLGKKDAELPNVSLANHPDRLEILAVTAVNKLGAKMNAFTVDVEDRSLVPLDIQGAEASGRFCELLQFLDLSKAQKDKLREYFVKLGDAGLIIVEELS